MPFVAASSRAPSPSSASRHQPPSSATPTAAGSLTHPRAYLSSPSRRQRSPPPSGFLPVLCASLRNHRAIVDVTVQRTGGGRATIAGCLPSSCPARNCIPNQLPSHANASKSGLFEKVQVHDFGLALEELSHFLRPLHSRVQLKDGTELKVLL